MTRTKQLNPPELDDVLDELKKDIFNTFNCHQVGIINSFNSNEQSAKIELKIKRVIDVNPDSSKVLKNYPLLVDCPVVVLSGGDSRLTFPVKKGDSCLVLFNDRELDNWFVSGQSEAPSSSRAHDLSDGIALVGIRHLQNAINDYLDDGTEWRYNSSSSIVQKTAKTTIKNTEIDITGKTNCLDILNVTKATNCLSTLNVTGAATFQSTINVTDVATFQGAVNAAGAATVTGELTINGGIKSSSGSLGIDQVVSWLDANGNTHTQTFEDGLLVGYTVT